MQSGPTETESFPFVVLGNKCDLKDARAVRLASCTEGGVCFSVCELHLLSWIGAIKVSNKQAVDYCKEKKILSKDQETPMYFEVSAKENNDVAKAFQTVATLALDKQPDDSM